MREKQNILKKERVHTILYAVGWYVAVAVAGLLSTLVTVMKDLNPLGIVLAGAVPVNFSPACSVGTFIGYLLFSPTDMPFRYIASLFAVTSIRLLSRGIKKISVSAPYLAFTVLVSVTICNLVTAVTTAPDVLLLVGEGVLAGGLTYFAARTLETDFKSGVGLTGEELVSTVITLDMLLCALIPLGFWELSFGRILMALLVLVAAKFGGISAGTICGAAVGFAAALSMNNAGFVSLYAVGGMISGIFSVGGRIAGTVGFLIPSVITLGVFCKTGFPEYIIEILIASGGFLLLPKNISVKIASLFLPPVKLESLDGMRKNLVLRLRLASAAMTDVSGTIDEVAKRLKKINAPDPSFMFDRAEKNACAGCSMRINCWETDRKNTLKRLGKLAEGIRKGEENLRTYAPDFYKNCLRPQKLQDEVIREFKEYVARLRAEERVEQVRGVVADQFEGISDMLFDLSEEFDTAKKYDLDIAETVVSALRDIDILTTDCGCSIDKYGRLSIDAKLRCVGGGTLNRRQILKTLEAALEKNFEPPTLKSFDDTVYMTVREKAVIRPEIGVSQITATETGICGDAYCAFGDGAGKFVMIISDGMGTGGRAAVDGAMASGLAERLLKAGFGYDCTLKIINSALLYKSTEESLATLDISVFDLYTGETGLYKAGAAPTYISRNGKIGKAESSSLPIGILRDVGFDRSMLTLSTDDVIVMFSDGVTASGSEWISHFIKRSGEMSAQKLAEEIADAAKRREDKNHPDDITVMVAYLNKNL